MQIVVSRGREAVVEVTKFLFMIFNELVLSFFWIFFFVMIDAGGC